MTRNHVTLIGNNEVIVPYHVWSKLPISKMVPGKPMAYDGVTVPLDVWMMEKVAYDIPDENECTARCGYCRNEAPE